MTLEKTSFHLIRESDHISPPNKTFQDIPRIPGLIQTQHVSVLTPNTTCHFLSHLGQPRSLDEVVEFTERRVPRETLNVPEEVLRLRLKQTPEEEVNQ